jgi:WD40 repeat protein
MAAHASGLVADLAFGDACVAVRAARLDLLQDKSAVTARPTLAATVAQSDWRLILAGHEGRVFSAAFSPDGARIVTASADYTARIWDAATGKDITVLRRHEGSVASAAFSPDGARIVTASGDNTARIWDAATGKEIMVLRGHEGSLRSAAFSPDGARIVTASGDNTARIWDVHFATMSTSDLVSEACLRRLRGLTTLTRDEMRLAGYADEVPAIDVCAGIE